MWWFADMLARPTGWDRDSTALDDMAPQEVSFEKCFYVHGGPDYLEVSEPASPPRRGSFGAA